MSASYETLEPSAFGKTVEINNDFSGMASSLVLTLVTVGVLVAIAFRFVPALIGFMSGDNQSKRSAAKENLWAGVFGLAFILLLIPFATSINSTIGKLELKRLKGGDTKVSTFVQDQVVSGSTGNKSCESVGMIKSIMTSSSGVCANKSCSSQCTFAPEVMSVIKSESNSKGVDYRYIAAIACRESGGNPNAKGKLANNGKPDCGLMQINSAICDDTTMNLKNNIDLGIDLFKSKLSNVSANYSNIKSETQALASYNCCSNGDNPNSSSNDCSTNTGFDFTLPKWACPINPGDGNFNMCAVKDYACDVTACASNY